MRPAIGAFVVTVCLVFGGFVVWAHHMSAVGDPSPVRLVVLSPGFVLGVWLSISAWRRPRST